MTMAFGMVFVGFSTSPEGMTASSNPVYAQKMRIRAGPKLLKPSGAKGTRFDAAVPG